MKMLVTLHDKFDVAGLDFSNDFDGLITINKSKGRMDCRIRAQQTLKVKVEPFPDIYANVSLDVDTSENRPADKAVKVRISALGKNAVKTIPDFTQLTQDEIIDWVRKEATNSYKSALQDLMNGADEGNRLAMQLENNTRTCLKNQALSVNFGDPKLNELRDGLVKGIDQQAGVAMQIQEQLADQGDKLGQTFIDIGDKAGSVLGGGSSKPSWVPGL
jgi:hypothetical protein